LHCSVFAPEGERPRSLTVRIPFAFFALTGICTVGLYLAYIIPVYLRLRRGDEFTPGPWNLGRRYRLVNTLAIIFVVLVVYSLNLPYTPAGLPWN